MVRLTVQLSQAVTDPALTTIVIPGSHGTSCEVSPPEHCVQCPARVRTITHAQERHVSASALSRGPSTPIPPTPMPFLWERGRGGAVTSAISKMEWRRRVSEAVTPGGAVRPVMCRGLWSGSQGLGSSLIAGSPCLGSCSSGTIHSASTESGLKGRRPSPSHQSQ